MPKVINKITKIWFQYLCLTVKLGKLILILFAFSHIYLIFLIIHKQVKSKRQSRNKSIILPVEKTSKLKYLSKTIHSVLCFDQNEDEWMWNNTTSCTELEYFIWWDHQVLWVLTVSVFGGSLDMLLSITLPDLISLLCFPVQPRSISPTVGNSDSYINLLSEQWQQRGGRERRRGRTGGEWKRERQECKERANAGRPMLHGCVRMLLGFHHICYMALIL